MFEQGHNLKLSSASPVGVFAFDGLTELLFSILLQL